MKKPKKLFIKTEGGVEPIDEAVAEKYNLKPGEEAPFTSGEIVDENGNAPQDGEKRERGVSADHKGELVNDEIAQLDNGMTLSISEMIDFSQGTDSSNR